MSTIGYLKMFKELLWSTRSRGMNRQIFWVCMTLLIVLNLSKFNFTNYRPHMVHFFIVILTSRVLFYYYTSYKKIYV